MTTFTRDMLPICGVSLRRFESEAEANAFAEWAEEETRNSHRPCEADVYRHDNGWEVRVSNW